MTMQKNPMADRLPPRQHADLPVDSRERQYSVLVYDTPVNHVGGDARVPVALYTTPGDTITLLELQGSDSIAVAFGSEGEGKFIPMREGDTFTRVFDQFRVRNLNMPNIDTTVGFGVRARAIFVVSFGPLVDRRFKPSGFVPGFPVAHGAATTTGTDVFSVLPLGSGTGTSPVGNPLRGGGSFSIKNISDSQRLYLYYGPPGAFDSTDVSGLFRPGMSYPIEPGAEFAVDADSAMRFTNGLPAVNGSTVLSVCVGAVSITPVPFVLVMSRPALDISDFESDAYPYKNDRIGSL